MCRAIPEYHFRSGQLLNVGGEKMCEEVFFRALGDAAKRWPSKLKDYTVASSQFGPASQAEVSHRYLLFLELDGAPLTCQQTAMVSGGVLPELGAQGPGMFGAVHTSTL